MKIWLLQHVHEFEDGREDVKLIGAFSSQEKAVSVSQELSNQPGFCISPEGWNISEYEVDSSSHGWAEGFSTYDTVVVPATLDGAEFLQPLQAWREDDGTFTIQTNHALASGIELKYPEGSRVRCRPHKIMEEITVSLAYELTGA